MAERGGGRRGIRRRKRRNRKRKKKRRRRRRRRRRKRRRREEREKTSNKIYLSKSRPHDPLPPIRLHLPQSTPRLNTPFNHNSSVN
jgi:hypothetical protein